MWVSVWEAPGAESPGEIASVATRAALRLPCRTRSDRPFGNRGPRSLERATPGPLLRTAGRQEGARGNADRAPGGAHCDANRGREGAARPHNRLRRGCVSPTTREAHGAEGSQRGCGQPTAFPGLRAKPRRGHTAPFFPGTPRAARRFTRRSGDAGRPCLCCWEGTARGNPRAPVHARATARTEHGRLRLETYVSHD